MNIADTDAVVEDENGNERFRTAEIEVRPLGNRRNEWLWAALMTLTCTGLVVLWFQFLATT